jgi:hypothetical protein
VRRTAEHNAKIAAALKGHRRSTEFREKMRQIALARGPVSAETRARMSASQKRVGNRPPATVRHGADQSQWKGDDCSYQALHQWLRREFPKNGVCERCGAERVTDYANVSGEYRRDRSDYLELCRSCHGREDRANPKRPRKSA